MLARLDDMKKVRGIIVYPRRIEELVRPHAAVDEFQIVFRRHDGLDEILVRIDPSPSLSLARSATALRRAGSARACARGWAPASVEIDRARERSALGSQGRRRVTDERTEVPVLAWPIP